MVGAAAGRAVPVPSTALIALARASHPGPTLVVSTLTAVLVAAVGHSLLSGVAVTTAVFTGQLSIGWSNDWLDRNRDAATARRDKPVARGELPAPLVLRAAVLALAACVPLSLCTGIGPGVLHLGAVASAWAYNLGLKATPASVLPYAVSFGLLPAYIVAAAPGAGAAPGWMVAAGALLGAGAHFANGLPDLDDDLATGVHGLGHRLGRAGCATAAAVLLLAATALLAAGPPGPPSPAGLAVVGVAIVAGATGLLAGRRPGSRAPFAAVLVIALSPVALLVASGTSLS
ncbi:UbiA family prenyltransferase [soil metagenome]